MIESIQSWITHWADTSYAVWILFGLAWCESFFLWVWPDLLLIAMSIVNPGMGLIYALICSTGSLIGGVTGYVIGLKGGRPLLERWVKPEKIQKIELYFNKYDAWAVGVAGFTPIPYNVFTLGAGAFRINFLRFFLASAVSRTSRFMLIGGSIMIFGEYAKEFIKNYFGLITLIIAIFVVVGFFLYKKFRTKTAVA